MAGGFLKIYDRNRALLMKVRPIANRLYKIHLETCRPIYLMTNLQDPAWLCLARLGNLNFHALKSMVGKQMAEGLPKIVHPNHLCESCLVPKQSRIPFPLQTSFRADKPLQLVHAYLCSPIIPATLVGNKYFMLTVDDYIW